MAGGTTVAEQGLPAPFPVYRAFHVEGKMFLVNSHTEEDTQ